MELAKPHIITQLAHANHNAECAYWWMKDIDYNQAQRLNVYDKIKTAMSLLQEVDNITMDIAITIKAKPNLNKHEPR